MLTGAVRKWTKVILLGSSWRVRARSKWSAQHCQPRPWWPAWVGFQDDWPGSGSQRLGIAKVSSHTSTRFASLRVHRPPWGPGQLVLISSSATPLPSSQARRLINMRLHSPTGYGRSFFPQPTRLNIKWLSICRTTKQCASIENAAKYLSCSR